ncbi:MAG TPA: TatD family hydrolase [Anaerolineae bacterium]|nr:TatD family hydrolase [Anaerolineae bacterium]
MTEDERRMAAKAQLSSSVVRPSSLVDTHCHLDWPAFDADRAEVIQRAIEASVTRMVTIGVDVASSRRAIELAEQYPAVYAAVGVHPNNAAAFNNDTLSAIRELAQHPKVVALGEIGLDNYWKKVAPAVQARAFVTQLELAAEIGKPVIIHSRETTADILALLEQHVARHPSRVMPGILHSFAGSIAAAQRAFELGFLIGFSGPVTFKKSQALRELARSAPLDRFVLETDAPFLTPEPRRGRRNEPANVRTIAEYLAHERPISVEEIARRTTANAARLFGWMN